MTKNELYQFLDAKGIFYEVTEHVPVYTIEEMLEANLPHPEIIAKNLFVRDDKKRNYYLITVKEDRLVNMKEFQEQFGTRRLSFASGNDPLRAFPPHDQRGSSYSEGIRNVYCGITTSI